VFLLPPFFLRKQERFMPRNDLYVKKGITMISAAKKAGMTFSGVFALSPAGKKRITF